MISRNTLIRKVLTVLGRKIEQWYKITFIYLVLHGIIIIATCCATILSLFFSCSIGICNSLLEPFFLSPKIPVQKKMNESFDCLAINSLYDRLRSEKSLWSKCESDKTPHCLSWWGRIIAENKDLICNHLLTIDMFIFVWITWLSFHSKRFSMRHHGW
jgi:hypothetical protein